MVSKLLDSVFARVYDPVMAGMERVGLADQRAQLLGGLEGAVLEIGAGTGLNLPAYPPTVRSLTLTDPTPQMVAELREKVAAARPDAVVVQAPADRLPFEDDTFDAVVTTLVLCSVPDVSAALAEIRRVLKPEGHLAVLEHVQADGAVAHAQWMFEPIQRVVGRGCRLTRDIRLSLAHAGFDVGAVVPGEMRGAPKIVRKIVMGVATAP